MRTPIRAQALDQGRISRRVGLELAPVSELALDLLSGDGDLAHLSALDLVDEVGEGQRWLRSAGRALEQIEEGEQQQHDDEPQRCVTAEIQILTPFLGATAACGRHRLKAIHHDIRICPAY
jgi:hypothetical protein